MLIPEEEAFLAWLSCQTEPVSARTMVERSAPHFTPARLENLRNKGWVGFTLIGDVRTGSLVGGYFIADEGRRVLLETQEARRQEAESKRQQALENKLSVVQILVPLGTFALGLLVEYFSGILSLLLGCV